MKNHCVNKLWRQRREMSSILLYLSAENLSAPLHIKLRLMENFVKCVDKTGRGFEYVRNKFQNMKAGIFVGPQVRQLIQDK
jgi:hypothetical protein